MGVETRQNSNYEMIESVITSIDAITEVVIGDVLTDI